MQAAVNHRHPKDVLRLRITAVKTQFILHPQKDKDAAAKPGGETEDIQGAEKPVACKLPDRCFEMILKHILKASKPDAVPQSLKNQPPTTAQIASVSAFDTSSARFRVKRK
jgi:hypothetical protein